MAAPDLEAVAQPQEKRAAREVAQRVFAEEFNGSKLEYKETGDRAPSFVVTPLGARVNRLFVTGVLTSNKPVGASGEMWHAEITDPTGVFHVFAGQYQPEAARALAELKPPCVVAVVGKSRIYSPKPELTYVSIRPESIRVVDAGERDAWIAETARFTLERLDCMRQATGLTPPRTADAVQALGYREDLADGAVRALAHYGTPEVQKWAGVLRDALEFLTPTGHERRQKVDAGFTVAASVQPGGAPVAVAQPAPVDEGASEVEEKVLALVEKHDDGKGAHWKDVVAEAAKAKIAEDQVEEALNGLMDKGLVYEPVLGRLKKAD